MRWSQWLTSVDFPTPAQATIVTTFTFSFAHASFRKAISSSRPKTSLPVTGNRATEIFFGASLAGGLRVPTRENGRGRLQEALASDSTPCVDSGCYRRYRLQQLVRSPKTLRRIFLKEFLKENYDRLWNIFESFTR